MASIFTYDPDPPRVASPWSAPRVPKAFLAPEGDALQFGGLVAPPPVLLAECGITKLEAEPQEGPTEYKLHLLLRPRRSFSSSSTGHFVSGSHQSGSKLPRSEYAMSGRPEQLAPIPTPTFQSRQNRLQHLTTQLLWRLQQSSPYHSSSTANLVLPILPEAASKSGDSPRPGRLLPGLEESRGALYEIGVSDDGTFVGLTKDELDESLTNLQAMAASLGCRVEILRTVIVGECERPLYSPAKKFLLETDKENLWVAEVLVVPETHISQHEQLHDSVIINGLHPSPSSDTGRTIRDEKDSSTAQLRVSLTGSTTSGKSSLLGTLSTSTLDNGRGKSRLSLLKHRHEIATGVTSSVAPELIGYKALSQENAVTSGRSDVINYGCGNISSWNDIHNAAESGRLVFVTDSAGHPRYRRTTVRGLVSWAPHWTVCCVAADDNEGIIGRSGSVASTQGVVGPTSASVDLSKAHLDLCLKLVLPLIIVITKYDLATLTCLKETLKSVLSIIKVAGRQPALLKPCTPVSGDPNLQLLQSDHEDEVKAILALHRDDACNIVPIVITSAVTGSGINKLHALLRHLPIPPLIEVPKSASPDGAGTSQIPPVLFHIDEVFTKAATNDALDWDAQRSSDSTFVLSGHLRYGKLSLRDELYIGPFTAESSSQDTRVDMYRARSYPGQLPARLSGSPWRPSTPNHHKRPLSGDGSTVQVNSEASSDLDSPDKFSNGTSTRLSSSEWQRVRIISIRNLRLPVRELVAGQVGTIGISFVSPKDNTISSSKVRKGMILAQSQSNYKLDDLRACSGFHAVFDEQTYLSMEPGQFHSTYVASIRATAKILSVETVDEADEAPTGHLQNYGGRKADDVDDVFGFDESALDDVGFGSREMVQGGGNRLIEVTFRFITYREWVEVGTQVLVMPGSSGAEGGVGLEAFVGKITGVLE
ncbi:hypothetical protein MMC19_000281 [Ptychographa xylographoides]|nr:hypothetical protein [Ptychographa xylographoides]